MSKAKKKTDRSRARARAIAAMREIRVPEMEAAMILYNGIGGVSVPFDKQPFHHDGYWSLGDGVAWGAILHPVKPKSPYKRGSIVSVNGKFHARVNSSEMELAGDRYGRDDKWTWRLCISALGARKVRAKRAVREP